MGKLLCEKPWRNLIVWADGSVFFCCEGEPVGHIDESTIEDIWNNEKSQSVRRGLVTGGDSLHAMCKRCPWIKDYIQKIH
jgi:radical SAM protein with 4Fe4S-binding SPASM domain